MSYSKDSKVTLEKPFSGYFNEKNIPSFAKCHTLLSSHHDSEVLRLHSTVSHMLRSKMIRPLHTSI